MNINILSSAKYDYLKNNLLKAEPSFAKLELYTEVFPDGEHYWRFVNPELIKGRPAVFVCGTVDNDAIFEAYNVASSLVREQCSSLHLVIPYFAYSTMERATKDGEVVTAKNIAGLLSSLPLSPNGNFIYMLDLHSQGMPYYFDNSVHTVHLTSWPVIKQMITDCGTDCVLASTDMGRAKWVEKMGNELNMDTAYIMKKRLSGTETKVLSLNAEVENRNVVIFDDMIRSGSSLIKAAEAYKNAGAKDVFVVSVHGVFVANALENIKTSGLIKSISCTNSHVNAVNLKDDFVKIYDISSVILDGLLL